MSSREWDQEGKCRQVINQYLIKGFHLQVAILQGGIRDSQRHSQVIHRKRIREIQPEEHTQSIRKHKEVIRPEEHTQATRKHKEVIQPEEHTRATRRHKGV